MASGHINRANRPNTWLHRPACRREEKPCQLGAVHTWHKADMPVVSLIVRFRGQSGRDVLVLSLSASDSKRFWECMIVQRSMERPDDLRGDQFRQEVQHIRRAMAAEGHSRNERLPVQGREASGQLHLARSQAYG